GGLPPSSTLTPYTAPLRSWFTATATGFSTTTSTSFTVTAGAATQLAFGTQPSTTAAGHQITPAVKVRALDALGNLVPGFTGNVTMTLGDNPGVGTLSGTVPVAGIGGVADFGDLRINRTGVRHLL